MVLCFYPIGHMILTVWISFVICHSLQIELKIPNSDSKNMKIICLFPSKKSSLKRKLNVRRDNLSLNFFRRNKRAYTKPKAVSLPNSVDSNQGFKCYTPSDYESKRVIKKRQASELSFQPASVEAVNGVCQPGHRIDQDRCYPCFPGSYTSGQETECFLCPKDFYMDKEAADSCWPCPEGKKTLAEGANSLDLCIHPDGSNNKGWILAAILLLLVLALSWIVVIGLIVYIIRLRKKRSLIKEKSRSIVIKKKNKKRETDIDESSSKSLSKKSSLNKGSSHQLMHNRTFESKKEETSPETQLLHTPEAAPHLRKELKKNVFEIRSPARKNFFFINRSGEPFVQDLLHCKNTNGRKEILKSGAFEYSVIDSDEASSNSDNYLSANGDERLSYIDQKKGSNMGKKIPKSLERKAKISGRKAKLRKKGSTRKLVVSNHNVNNDFNQENGLFPPELKSVSSRNSQSDARKISTSESRIEESDKPPSSEKISRNSLEKQPIQVTLTPATAELKSENHIIIPNHQSSKVYESTVSIPLTEPKSSSQKSLKFTSSHSLYVPAFNDHQLIDFNPDSPNGTSASTTQTGITSLRSRREKNSFFSSSSLKEIKISIDPDTDSDTKNVRSSRVSKHSVFDEIQQLNKEIKNSMEPNLDKDPENVGDFYSSQHSIFDEIQQFTNVPNVCPFSDFRNEPNVCPLHGRLNSIRSSPIHVDINLQFVT
ncbi:uncharacterized protein [Parasteatoda tepidariorum]|uniref:uncharacterized protein n=1 Tax=Parasteatoda tepidariorum TaxID=114398 RepID=UPI0039BCAF5F